MGDTVDAAGGVVWRREESGGIEVVLIHRPLRDDWTLPMGRVERDESLVECAEREVREETGLNCIVGRFLETLEVVGEDDGLTHRFHLFAMTATSGEFEANPETDAAPWLSLAEARARATYENVRDLLKRIETECL